MVCDLIVVSKAAKFGDLTLRLGVIPGAGTTQSLTRLIARSKMKELLFTGELLDPREAERL